MKTLINLFKGKRNSGESAAVMQNQYYCPMKCEGEKTYGSPGNCPVCNMKLVPVTSGESTEHDPGHNGHSHHGCC